MTPFVKKYGYNDNKYLGIVRFAFDFISGMNPKYGIAPMHIDLLRTFLNDHPDKINLNRLFCYLTFRDAAKTTWFGVVVPSYFACMNGDIWWGNYNLPPIQYNVIKGKNGVSAEKTFKRVLTNLMSPKINEIFGQMVPTIKDVKDKNGTANSKLLVTTGNRFILEALSIGKMIRGANMFDMRPQYICFDDPENKENTKTEERRRANYEDLISETIPAMDTFDGRLVYVCNFVHQDCIGANLLKDKGWIHRLYALSYHDKDGVEKATWEKRFPMPIIEKRKNFYRNSHVKGGLKSYYMEYYNKIISDSSPVYKTDYEWKYVRKNNMNFLVKNGEYKNIYVAEGYDPAQSEKSQSSDSAIVIAAMDSDGNKFILDWFVGKLDLHDKYEEKLIPIYPFAVTPNDLEGVWKRGGIEELCRYIVKYDADAFSIETASQQRGIYNEVRDRLDRVTPDFMASKGLRGRSLRSVIGEPFTPHTDKQQKLAASVMKDFEGGLYTVINPRPELRTAVETFPDSKLDILDALYLADRILVAPIKVVYNPLVRNLQQKIKDAPEYESEEIWMVQ